MQNSWGHLNLISKIASLETILDNLSNTGRTGKQIISICVDSLMVIASIWGAYSLRLGVFVIDFMSTWHLFAILTISTPLIFMSLGIYRWVVRSSTTHLVSQIIKGCALSTVLMLSILFISPPSYAGTPRSLFIIYGLLLLGTTLGSRYLWKNIIANPGSELTGEPVALYGAGLAGQQLVAMLKLSSEYNPMLFLDDNARLNGSTVSGLPVYQGRSSRLRELLKKYDISTVILSMPSVRGYQYQAILDYLNSQNLNVKTMPPISEIILGKASLDEVREVAIEDLLGRSPVLKDLKSTAASVKGKSILVTGGGGSIGSEICRQVILMGANRLTIVDQSEENLYNISEELIAVSSENNKISSLSNTKIRTSLASVNQGKIIGELIKENKVDIVYHAAACKHVPIVEENPEKGYEINVLGTKTVLEESLKNHVELFVLVSTDKAVRPTNVMGSTKRIAEMVVQSKSLTEDSTKICMVRFGNVLGSSGSVVPKFTKQIENGGPVTVTDKRMTRYFMTIPEASQLVIHAGSLAESGEVFVLDMGEPVKIVDLAKSMIHLHGKQLKSESANGIDIVFEGIRPGEKIYEELFISGNIRKSGSEKIFIEDVTKLEWNKIESILKQANMLISDGKRGDLVKYLKSAARSDQRFRTTRIKKTDIKSGAV